MFDSDLLFNNNTYITYNIYNKILIIAIYALFKYNS